MNDRKSIMYIFIATFCYGLMPIFTSFCYQSGLQPGAVVAFRFGGASVILCLYFVLSGNINQLRIPKKTILFIFLFVAFTYWLTIESKLFAFKIMPKGIVQAIFYGYPIVVIVYTYIRGLEKRNNLTLIGYCIVLCGILLSLDFSDSRITVLGIGLSCISALSYAIYVLQLKKKMIACLPSVVITTYVTVFSFIFSLLFIPPLRKENLIFSRIGWFGITGLVLISSIASLLFFNKGIKQVDSSIAVIICSMEPLITILLEIVFRLGSYSLKQYIGIAVIPIGVGIPIVSKFCSKRGNV